MFCYIYYVHPVAPLSNQAPELRNDDKWRRGAETHVKIASIFASCSEEFVRVVAEEVKAATAQANAAAATKLEETKAAAATAAEEAKAAATVAAEEAKAAVAILEETIRRERAVAEKAKAVAAAAAEEAKAAMAVLEETLRLERATAATAAAEAIRREKAVVAAAAVETTRREKATAAAAAAEAIRREKAAAVTAAEEAIRREKAALSATAAKVAAMEVSPSSDIRCSTLVPSSSAPHHQAGLKLAKAEEFALSAHPKPLLGASAALPLCGGAGGGSVVPQLEAPSLYEAAQAGDMEAMMAILKAGGSTEEADKVRERLRNHFAVLRLFTRLPVRV